MLKKLLLAAEIIGSSKVRMISINNKEMIHERMIYPLYFSISPYLQKFIK